MIRMTLLCAAQSAWIHPRDDHDDSLGKYE